MSDTEPDKQLIDPFGRRVEYVRLSVTDKCNMRCFYCIPKGFKNFEEPENWLSFDEVERLMRIFADLGVRRVRLTGGEPLVRKNLPELAARLSVIPGIEDLSLSTNASLLSEHAVALKEAGISRINVSLDSLQHERFNEITGGRLQTVLDGLQAAKSAGLNPVKINVVAMKGLNDDEFESIVDYCLENDFTLRFIETMPIGSTGKDAIDYYYDLQKLKKRLQKRFSLIPGMMPGGGPARYFQVKGTELRIGFITPISQHFCETCNRVRVSVNGTLYLCLGQNDKVELRPLLRDGSTDEQLREAIVAALALKPMRHEFKDEPGQIVRIMSQTGG
jgi:cyclic pyranopterin phosphate synthase